MYNSIYLTIIRSGIRPLRMSLAISKIFIFAGYEKENYC